MDDRSAENTVKRDDACQIVATQPSGVVHPPIAVVGVKSFKSGIIIHRRRKETVVKVEPHQAGKARTNMRRLEPGLKIMIAVACFLAILLVLCDTLNRLVCKGKQPQIFAFE
jgi:hypothetical protein